MLFRTFTAASLLATPLMADDSTRAEDLLKLIRDNGCQMTTAEAGDILPQHNFTMDETRDLVRALAEDGMVDMNGFAGVKLSEKGCQGA